MFKQTLAAAALLTISTSMSASASDNANAHFKAIGTGNVEESSNPNGSTVPPMWNSREKAPSRYVMC